MTAKSHPARKASARAALVVSDLTRAAARTETASLTRPVRRRIQIPGKKSAPPAEAPTDSLGGWTELSNGTVVLATDDPEAGWFAAIVQRVNGETLTLRWQLWPHFPEFKRKLNQVGLLHPEMVKPC